MNIKYITILYMHITYIYIPLTFFVFRESSYDMEFSHLLRGADTLGGANVGLRSSGSIGDLATLLSGEQANALKNLLALPPLTDLGNKLTKDQLKKFLSEQHPELSMPVVWQSKDPISNIRLNVCNFLYIA